MKIFFTTLVSVLVIIALSEKKSFAQQINLMIVSDSIHFSGDPDVTFVSVTIMNEGDTTSKSTYITYYANIDSATIDPTDSTLIWAQAIPPILPNAIFTIDTSIDLCNPTIVNNLPLILQFGFGFYLGYVVDDGDLNHETNESDNTGINSEPVNLLCTVGTNDLVANDGWNIFPNPATDLCTIEIPSLALNNEISIFNTMGERVFYSQVKTSTSTISLASMPSGIYWVEWNNSRKKMIRI